jgi:hypothetical protein
MDFWKNLKAGSDHFELTQKPPRVDVCDRRYVFNADAGGANFTPTAACPAYTQPDALVAALERKQAEDEAAILAAISTMEAKAAAEAEAVQVAAATAAEKERRAAERAAQPSLVSQLLTRVGIGGGQEETPPNLDTAPVASVAPVSVPEPRVIASVPVPTTRPAATPPAVAAAVEPPPLAPTALVEERPAATPPPDPAVGTFVKKKFLWPGEEDPDAPPPG